MAALPKSLVISFDYISKEVPRLMNDAKRGPMARKDWDKINSLLELFSEDIRTLDDYQEALKTEGD